MFFIGVARTTNKTMFGNLLDNNHLPELSEEMIEKQAECDLTKYFSITKPKKPFPIYPEHLAQVIYGIEIVEQDDLADDNNNAVLACFVASEKKIYFNTSMPSNSGRTSFTMAHEVGHVSLHNFLSNLGAQKELCAGSSSAESRAKAIEKQADKYAAALLMPRIPFVEEVKALGNSEGSEIDCNNKEVFGEIKSKFGVSHYALENRLLSLGYSLKNQKYQHYKKKLPDSLFTSEEERNGWR